MSQSDTISFQEEITIKLKAYDTLIRVLSEDNMYRALEIDMSNKNKHEKLRELLKQRVVLEFIKEEIEEINNLRKEVKGKL